MDTKIDDRPFAYFRIFFGILMGWQLWTVITTKGLISDFLASSYFFTYPGFDWVQPLSTSAMQAIAYLMFVAAVCFALGFLYRLSTAILLAGYSYIFLLDQTLFFQQFYLMLLLLFLLFWIPANSTLSIDSIRTKVDKPKMWHLYALRFQIAVVYIFAGLFKLNSDWFAGQPIQTWLPEFPEYAIWTLVYGGVLFNLFIIPILLYRKTNTMGLILVCIFHLANEVLFNIAAFPWLMLAATVLFFYPQPTRNEQQVTSNGTLKRLCIIYIAIQILVPLRVFLYPGNSSWTEEGRKFSWQMMLRYKEIEFQMYAVNPNTEERSNIDLRKYLNEYQATIMQRDPTLTAQFARWVSTQYDPPAAIYAQTLVAFNGRAPQDLIDTTMDLAKTTQRILPATWIKAL